MPAYTDRFIEVRADLVSHVVVLRRTPVSFSRVDDIERSFEGAHAVLDGIERRRFGLLIDARDAPIRMAPAYQPAFERHRVRATAGFRAVAVLVRTAIGESQVRRASARSDAPHHVFGDEDEARSYLRERLAS